MRRNCIALQNGEALLFPRQPHLCSPFYSLHLLYTHTHTHTYIYIPRNFNQLSFNGGVLEKNVKKRKKKDPRFTLDRIHRGMDAEGEETSEIAIKRMTKQKKRKNKKGGDRRRGDPVVINGTRSMRKHYVIDGESSASVRAPFSNLRCLFNSIQPIFLEVLATGCSRSR